MLTELFFCDQAYLWWHDPYNVWLCPVRNWCEPKPVLTWAFWTRTCSADACSSTAQSFSSFFAWWTLPTPSESDGHWQIMLLFGTHLASHTQGIFFFSVLTVIPCLPSEYIIIQDISTRSIPSCLTASTCLWTLRFPKALLLCLSSTLKMWLSFCFLLCSKFTVHNCTFV